MKKITTLAVLATSLIISSISNGGDLKAKTVNNQNKVNTIVKPVNENKSVNAKLHFINTGQSDAILVESDGEFMLIDGGDKDDDSTIKAYLNKVGVKQLKYVIVTHFHADHIGGLDTIIKDFKVENVYVPNGNADTQVYRDFINSCINRNLKPSVPLPDTIFTLGNSTFRFLNVKGGYENINNNSLVVELTSGKTKTLFTGDAEKEVENALLNELTDVDILKVAHHGSSSSTTQAFLDKVNPEVAIIQTATNNKYGHPHVETMHKLQAKNIKVHRNDECGDIVYTITNEGYSTECIVEGSYNNGNQSSSSDASKNSTQTSVKATPKVESAPTPVKTTSTKTVYWTPKGKSYHATKSCGTLSRSKTILEGSLKESGKTDPCDVCYK